MISYYKIEKNNILKTNKEDFNWLVIEDETENEICQICKTYNLSRNVFTDTNFSEGTSKLETLNNTELINPYLIVLLQSNGQSSFVENQITPLSFILSEELMITYHAKDDSGLEHWISNAIPPFVSFEQILALFIIQIYSHLTASLKEIKNTIDQLNQSAKQTAKNKELIDLSDTERSLIFLYHLLHDQHETLEKLFNHQKFKKKVVEIGLINKVQQTEKQTLKLVNVYRDLLVSISSLFSSLIDNNLNHLMKYLETLEILLAFPALVAGIWGMNIGGLPGEKSTFGFWTILVFILIFTIVLGAFLHHKNYDK